MPITESGMVYEVVESVKSTSFPTLLYVLHDYSSDAQEALRIAESLRYQELIVIALQGPVALAGGGYAWFDAPDPDNPLMLEDGMAVVDADEQERNSKMMRAGMQEIHKQYGTPPSPVHTLALGQGVIQALSNLFEKWGHWSIQMACINGAAPRTTVDEIYHAWDQHPLSSAHSQTRARYKQFFLAESQSLATSDPSPLAKAEEVLVDLGYSVTRRPFDMGAEPSAECLAALWDWFEDIKKTPMGSTAGESR